MVELGSRDSLMKFHAEIAGLLREAIRRESSVKMKKNHVTGKKINFLHAVTRWHQESRKWPRTGKPPNFAVTDC